jgi:hypothetical protein
VEGHDVTKTTNNRSQPEEAKSARGRYRKVEVRTWGDEKFRNLSPMPPCGQGLWLFLIPGPHTSPIPGLFRAGRAAMAEELGWEVEAFDKAFGEALGQGMVKADFKARVIWVPNAIKHNKPESPNVVRSWGAEFDLIPECDLKWMALESLKASIHALGESYGKAFDETFSKPSVKPSVKPLPKTSPNQEQEQEQEQEQDKKQEANASLPPGNPAADVLPGLVLTGGEPKSEPPPCPHLRLLALFAKHVPELPQPRRELWEGSAGAEAMRQRWKWLLTSTRDNSDERYATTVEEGLDWFDTFFATVSESDFLTGRAGKWRSDLTWLMKRENFIKVVQGNYENKPVRRVA